MGAGGAMTGVGLQAGGAAGAAPRSDSARLTSQGAFLVALGRASRTPPSADPEERAMGAARQFVSQALVEPVLRQIRSTDDSAPPFAPGPGEKQFRALLDAETAQRIVMATRFPLVEQVARKSLLKGRAPKAPDQSRSDRFAFPPASGVPSLAKR